MAQRLFGSSVGLDRMCEFGGAWGKLVPDRRSNSCKTISITCMAVHAHKAKRDATPPSRPCTCNLAFCARCCVLDTKTAEDHAMSYTSNVGYFDTRIISGENLVGYCFSIPGWLAPHLLHYLDRFEVHHIWMQCKRCTFRLFQHLQSILKRVWQ